MTANYSTDQINASSGGSTSSLVYLLVGTGIGAALGLLFAPKSGSELRGSISDITQRGYGKTTELAGRVKEQSANMLQTAKDKAGDLFEMASSLGTDLTNKAEDTANGVSKELATGVQQLEEKFGEHQTNSSRTGRRSSSIV